MQSSSNLRTSIFLYILLIIFINRFLLLTEGSDMFHFSSDLKMADSEIKIMSQIIYIALSVTKLS
jgi:hypothetical protein